MNKKISTQVIKNIIDFIKKSDYYNKIQITFNRKANSFLMETFYFFENKWGYSVLKVTEGSQTPETIQDMQTIEDDNKLIERLGMLEPDAEVIIASNSSEYTLSVKL